MTDANSRNSEAVALSHCDAVILCGGRSNRMGEDKTQLPFAATSLMEHVISRVLSKVHRTIVVAAPEQRLTDVAARATVIRDLHPHQGPVAGLMTALQWRQNQPGVPPEFLLLMSCDMPFVDVSVFSDLLSVLRKEPDLFGICLKHNGRTQPFHSVLRTSATRGMEQRHKQGERSLTRLLTELPVREIECSDHWPQTAEYFLTNVNSPDDYRRALQMWQQVTLNDD